MNKSYKAIDPNRTRGAPKYGLQHWFLWDLPSVVRKDYKIIYNANANNYMLIRLFTKSPDYYIIVRTSRKCWRLTYCNSGTPTIEYKTFATGSKVADFISTRFVAELRAKGD